MTATTHLKRAIAELQGERERIDRQIAALQSILDGGPTTRRGRAPGRKRGRRRVSAAARAAASKRMKAYWAKRKKGTRKKNGE
jgi:hypothetical protein